MHKDASKTKPRLIYEKEILKDTSSKTQCKVQVSLLLQLVAEE